MLGLLTHRFAAPVLAVALIASLGFAGLQSIRLHESQRALEAATARFQQCAKDLAKADAAISLQNARVREAASQTAQMQKRAEKAAADALRGKQEADRRVTSIMAAQAGDDRCAAADALILKVAG